MANNKLEIMVDVTPSILPLEVVLISKKQYQRLLKREELLDWLEMKGVDNWEGFCHPPDRDDYETDEEYQKAWDY